MSSITVTGVANVPTPRGAIWAARGAAAAWNALSRWLATRRPASGRPALHDVARDAEMVRELARRHAAADPGFAADLLAAADRHEAATSR